MLRTPTCLILGAGASRDIGMPLGGELVRIIRQMARTDLSSRSSLGPDPDGLLSLVARTGEGVHGETLKIVAEAPTLCASVDDFLYLHRSNTALVHVVKRAIARTILAKEGASSLAFKNGLPPDSDAISKTWYAHFFRSLVAGSSPETIFDRLTVISFNYDRAFEWFLFCAVRSVFALNDSDAAATLKRLRIYHPYGSVGHLLQPATATHAEVPFGDETDYAKVASEILTYSEQSRDEALQIALRQSIRESERLVFVGFGFHQQNMELLRPAGGVTTRPFYASAMGFEREDVPGIIQRVQTLFEAHSASSIRSEGVANIAIGKGSLEFLSAYQTTLFN